MNMRTLENPMQIKTWSATGANTSPIAFTELYKALAVENSRCSGNTTFTHVCIKVL